ncbi:unnamed protein product [Rhizophagus irregularis]|nr:unnamed protein product [Rhizophagus irregularis]
MAPPTSPISQRTRSGTANSAELLGDSSEETFQRGKTHDNISAPYNINKPLEPKEVSNRRDTRKKKQQVQFSTNITGPAQQEASPIFLHRSPETINNNVDQSNLQNSNVNKNDGNKQTLGQITGQSSADQNISKSVNKNVDQQIELPDIDMIDSTHEDVLEQPRKLEQEKILAKLHVQIDDAANIDEYRKFIKVVQNHILEDIGLKQENIINLQTQVITQTNDNNNKDKQKENGPSQTPRIITGIALLATIISRETLNSLIETPYSCDNKEYYFEEVITAKAKQLQKNKNSRDRMEAAMEEAVKVPLSVRNKISEWEIRQDRYSRNRQNNNQRPTTYAQIVARGGNRNKLRNNYNNQRNQRQQWNGKYIDRSWNRNNINRYNEEEEIHDTYNEEYNGEMSSDETEMRGGSMHMNNEERKEFNQINTNENLNEIRNDFAKIKDMMDCLMKEQSSMRKELEVIKIQNNTNLKDKSQKPLQATNSNKKREGVIFNSSGK